MLPLAIRFSEPARATIGIALLLAASVALGAGVALGWPAVSDHGKLFLYAAGTAAAIRIIAWGPLACLMAIGFAAAAGLDQPITDVGQVTVVIPDVFYAGAVVMLVLEAVARIESQPHGWRLPRPRMGQGAAAAFIAFAGLSIWHVANVAPSESGESLVSWLRLVQTASLAWMLVAAIKTPRDVKWFLIVLACGGVVGAGSLVVDAFSDIGSVASSRFGGLLGVNAGGLVGGVLITLGAFGGPTFRKDARIGFFVAGVIALLICKSVAGLTGTGLVLAVGLGMRRHVEPVRRLGTLLVALALIGVVVYGMVNVLRPSNAPGSAKFGDSSTLQRAMLGTAGIEIWKNNMVIGAGWRRSQQPEVIGAPDVAEAVRKRFPHAREDFYPDVTPLTVHNAYIQIMADLGSVGMGFFLVMLLAIARGARRLVRRLTPGEPLWDMAWVAALGLLLTAVWLNDNPLYGGQIETILVALLIGCLAAIDRIAPRAPAGIASR